MKASQLVLLLSLCFISETKGEARGVQCYKGGDQEKCDMEKIIDLGRTVERISSEHTNFTLQPSKMPIGSLISMEIMAFGRFEITLGTVGTTHPEFIPLSIEVRPDEEEIVFNSFAHGTWDFEERRHIFSDLKKTFLIEILIDKGEFVIFYGPSIKTFSRWMPLNKIEEISVLGDSSIKLLSIYRPKIDEEKKRAEL